MHGRSYISLRWDGLVLPSLATIKGDGLVLWRGEALASEFSEKCEVGLRVKTRVGLLQKFLVPGTSLLSHQTRYLFIQPADFRVIRINAAQPVPFLSKRGRLSREGGSEDRTIPGWNMVTRCSQHCLPKVFLSLHTRGRGWKIYDQALQFLPETPPIRTAKIGEGATLPWRWSITVGEVDEHRKMVGVEGVYRRPGNRRGEMRRDERNIRRRIGKGI